VNAHGRHEMQTLYRWAKFNAVGALGFCIQLGALWLLIVALRLSSLVATALAVEMAVVHNFVWHQFLTWKDRSAETRYAWLKRLFAFNLTNGAVSLAGNLFFAWLIVGRQRIWLLAANLFAIAVCSLVNFVLSDRLIFRTAPNEPQSSKIRSRHTFGNATVHVPGSDKAASVIYGGNRRWRYSSPHTWNAALHAQHPPARRPHRACPEFAPDRQD
jgi:putative flippase GtrA